MADTFATLDDLLARLDWDLSPEELRIAESALEDLSDDARLYGSSSWTPVSAPRMVRTRVLRAAVRYMRNPDGYITSRAGDEIVGWAPKKVSGAEFTADEIAELKDAAKRAATLNTVGTYAYMNPAHDQKHREIHVPVHYHGKGMIFP